MSWLSEHAKAKDGIEEAIRMREANTCDRCGQWLGVAPMMRDDGERWCYLCVRATDDAPADRMVLTWKDMEE